MFDSGSTGGADPVGPDLATTFGVDDAHRLAGRLACSVLCAPFAEGAQSAGLRAGQVTAYPVGAHEEARCIDYTTHTANDLSIGALYVVVTCGPALMSGRRHLRWLGVVSLVGVIAAAVVRVDELTSLWCVYVAPVSVLILGRFRRQRASEMALPPSVARPEPGPT